MKVLVCGGRNFGNKVLLWRTLDALYREHEFTCLIHGDARGADALADLWAKERGVQRVICPADWNALGVSAGPIRNERMLELKPDIVVAFPGGRGTGHMVSIASKAGVKVVEVSAS